MDVTSSSVPFFEGVNKLGFLYLADTSSTRRIAGSQGWYNCLQKVENGLIRKEFKAQMKQLRK